jgi:hypothetical protein
VGRQPEWRPDSAVLRGNIPGGIPGSGKPVARTLRNSQDSSCAVFQLAVGSVVYYEVTTFQLGAWWSAIISIVADVAAIFSYKR